MHKSLFAVAASALALGACTYHPTPESVVHVVDSPVDVTACRLLGELGGPVPTGAGFDRPLDAWIKETAARGGNTLYVRKRSPDWALVHAKAYRCNWLEPFFKREGVVISAKG
jgi:hypothetical protein